MRLAADGVVRDSGQPGHAITGGNALAGKHLNESVNSFIQFGIGDGPGLIRKRDSRSERQQRIDETVRQSLDR
jgi:hypothetical protein